MSATRRNACILAVTATVILGIVAVTQLRPAESTLQGCKVDANLVGMTEAEVIVKLGEPTSVVDNDKPQQGHYSTEYVRYYTYQQRTFAGFKRDTLYFNCEKKVFHVEHAEW